MKSIIKVSGLLLLTCIFILAACKKKSESDAPSKLPVVTIDSITNISLTTADVNADITFNGGFSVTQKGICWGLNQNPTITDSKTSAGPGDDWFSGKITGLQKGKSYFVRAYATNSEGTGYSGQQTVKPGTVTDIDNNLYDVVSISSKNWMAGNLKVKRYSNGDPIPLVTDNAQWNKLKTGAYCYVNGSNNNTNDYGLLYNGYAALDSRGICPNGYRSVYYGAYATLGGSSDGGPLKITGTTFWKTPNTGATNSSGFSAKGTGFRDTTGTFMEFNETTYFWSTEINSTYAVTAFLEYNSTEYLSNWYNREKRFGFCIRCIQK